MSIVSVRDVSAFEELSVCYNYRLHEAPTWYRECWTRWAEARNIRQHKIRSGDKVQVIM